MQEYLQKTRLSGVLDGFGFHILSILLSFIWFISLWGLRLPALTGGAALYILIVLLRKKIRDDQVTRKEKELRAVIGGELALERLLVSPPERAHFEIAVLLSLRYSLMLLQTGQDGVLCDMKGKKLLISFIQRAKTTKLCADAVLEAQRNVKLHNADFGLLCVPCPIAQEAREQALEEPPVYFLSRETLAALFGEANPATDNQLVMLGKRRKQRLARNLGPRILHEERAKKYACYGILLLTMYQFTHLIYHALPGLICVFLAAACRCARKRQRTLSDLFSSGA